MTANPTVYILDDDPAVRRSLTRLLKSGGYEPHAFASVAGFLELKKFAPRACVIADIRMAGGSGLGLPDLLKQRNELLPVIIVTAADSDELRREAYSVGIASFFRKPVDDQALFDAIEWALGIPPRRPTASRSPV